VVVPRVQAIVETLQATSRYHATSFAAADFALVGKLCSWPAAQLFPALDLLRMLLLHPEAARHYAAPPQDELWAVLNRAGSGSPPLPANLITATRTAVNTFRHAPLQEWARAHQAQVRHAPRAAHPAPLRMGGEHRDAPESTIGATWHVMIRPQYGKPMM
jgi:phospholipase A-2-activating protein